MNTKKGNLPSVNFNTDLKHGAEKTRISKITEAL